MFNSVNLIGRLGRDPELRFAKGGKAVANFSLATNGPGKDAEPEWHNIVVWEAKAENCAKYLSKGKLAHVSGRIQSRNDLDVTRRRF